MNFWNKFDFNLKTRFFNFYLIPFLSKSIDYNSLKIGKYNVLFGRFCWNMQEKNREFGILTSRIKRDGHQEFFTNCITSDFFDVLYTHPFTVVLLSIRSSQNFTITLINRTLRCGKFCGRKRRSRRFCRAQNIGKFKLIGIWNGNRDHATSSKRWRLERFI